MNGWSRHWQFSSNSMERNDNMKNAKMNALFRMMHVLIAAMACAGVAQAGNVCTWTGLAGDGKWSSPENWDVQPVSGNLDEVRMSAVNGSSISNDVPGMSVAKLIFTGNEEVEFSGEQVTIANVSADSYTIVWSNACPVLCHTPLKLDSRHWRIFASAEVRFMGELYSRFSDVYCLVTDNKPGAVIEIHGGLTAAGGSIFMDSRSDIRIFSPVTGGRLRFNSNNYTGVGTNSFHAPLAIKLGISYRLCVCHAENILYPDGDIIWEGTHTGGCLDLNGFDQTSGCLGGV